MTLFNTVTKSSTINKYLAAGMFIGVISLTGCQSENTSAPAVDSQNNDSTNAASLANDVSNGVDANDIAPSYVEGDADAVNVSGQTNPAACENIAIVAAFEAQQSDQQVKGCGTIVKALPDDNEGGRHQRILIELDSISPQHSVLLVHNIDLASPIIDVVRGAPISFYGEYVYNDQGGLVHWTHHDPAGQHQGGWIESNGIRYQ